jgi:hypothetical protein
LKAEARGSSDKICQHKERGVGSPQHNDFDSFTRLLKEKGIEEAFVYLSQQMREQKKYFELFEVLKMQLRHRLGLPLAYDDSGDELDEANRNKLEEGLFQACREVGTLLMKEGKVRDGWMYLRPVGDRKYARTLLELVPVTDENADAIIEVGLSEGVSPVYAYSLILNRYGTCNSITAFDTEMAHKSLVDRRAAAALLVQRLHDELIRNIKTDIERNEGKAPASTNITELIATRPWLFDSGRYHLDTTHLSAVVRFARSIVEPAILSLAIELADYGKHLDRQYHYAGEAPFEDIFESHWHYLRTVSGRDVEAGLEYFRLKAESTDAYQEGTMPLEIYVELLSRLGRHQQAIEYSIQKLPDRLTRRGTAPSLIDLSRAGKSFERLKSYCREKDDLLGFAMGSLLERTDAMS